MDKQASKRIRDAIDRRFDEQVEFLAEVTRHASTRGAEQPAQRFMQRELETRGYATELWEIDVDEISGLPGFSPVIGNYDEALNLVATHRGGGNGDGRSLILNGHIDVVPEGPLDMWRKPPYEPWCDDGWMYGRGAGDMKAGLVANLFALDGLRDAGYRPAADVYFQSVVEEECTGNGALACLQRGYRADAALIPEPFDEQLVSAQLGVIWMQVYLRGNPVHAMTTSSGVNAIEAAFPLIAALRRLEESWNERPGHARFEHVEHPLNLNIGRIEGGDWASSVPAWCCFDVRMGIYPGQDIDAAGKEIEDCIRAAAGEDPYLCKHPPRITYHGFLAEGYALADHDNPDARLAQQALERAHRSVTGEPLKTKPITATTDARFFGLYADTPALVYGPRAESIHGFDERVDLESTRRVTHSIALFIADWCGLEKRGKA